MQEINSYAISWTKIKDNIVYFIINIDGFDKPFIRVIKDAMYSDILISDNPKIIDGVELDFEFFSNFIYKNQKTLLLHWNNQLSSDGLFKNLK